MSSAAVASMVGDRTWRSWAGRPANQGEDFALSDVALGLWRSARWHWRSAVASAPPRGQTCPICFDTPESDASDAWQRLWCGCSVCSACVGTWVKTALEASAGAAIEPDAADDVAVISLSCPACAAPLRACDAKRVLARDVGLLGDFDVALRDACLRGQRDFRPCSHCKGGGFVTWHCVAQARSGARGGALLLASVLAAFCVGVGSTGQLLAAVSSHAPRAPRHATPWLWRWPSQSHGDIGATTWMTLVLVALVSRLGAAATRSLARAAAANAPLHVACPECDATFSLAAADAAADAVASPDGEPLGSANAGDAAWVREHTRPCPRCRAPILKNGGCNAMRCARCGVSFCWACMRSSRECTHFHCAHGAPHGNASTWTALAAVNGDALAAAGERAARLARASAALADALAFVALLLVAMCAAGAPDDAVAETARTIAANGDALLAVPAHAWRAFVSVAPGLVSLALQAVLTAVSYGVLGLIGIIAWAFAMHAVGIPFR